MSLTKTELVSETAVFVLKTALSQRATSGQSTVDVNLSGADSSINVDMTSIFQSTQMNFNDWRDAVQIEADQLLATLRATTGAEDAGLMSQMNKFPTLIPFVERLKKTNKTKLLEHLSAYVPSPDDQVEPDAAAEIDSDTPSYTPILIPNLDLSTLSTLDSVVRSASGGAFRSAIQVFQQLETAQRFIAQNRSAAPKALNSHVGANGAFPSGVCQIMPASTVFIDCIPTPDLPRFSFDIPVYKWDSRHPLVPSVARSYQYDPDNLYCMLWAIARGKNVALVGPTGCGKTTTLEQLAARLGRPFFRIPVDGEMQKRDIIGGFKQVSTPTGSHTKWFDGLLAKAITMPSIIDIDEMDRANPDLQYVAHQAYERAGLTITEDEGRYIAPHEHHAIMATANTRGREDGENAYSLQHQMSEATRDRFAFWIDCTYMTEAQEMNQLQIDVPMFAADSAKRLIRYANMMRASFIDNRLSTTCSYRQLLASAEFAVTKSRAVEDQRAAELRAIKAILINRVPLKTDTAAMLEFGRQVYGNDWKI